MCRAESIVEKPVAVILEASFKERDEIFKTYGVIRMGV